MNAAVPELHSPDHPHFAQFYESELFLVEKVAAFLKSSLDAGGAAVVIATPAHCAAVRAELGLISTASLTTPGVYTEIDAQQMLDRLFVDGKLDPARFRTLIGAVLETASAAGNGQIHAFGEMVALLCLEGRHNDAVALEGLWNKLAGSHSFALFCGYPLHAFSNTEQAESFRRICDAHAFVHHAETLKPGQRDQRIAELQQRSLWLDDEIERRRNAEGLLRERERELVDFVDNAAEGLHQVAADGTILWANRAELDLLGYAADEYVGRHIADFHVDKATIDDILRRLGAGETLYDYPARLRCKDGSIKHVLIHSNARFEDGQLRYTRCFTRDVSDRVLREAAQHERNELLRQAPVPTALLIGPEHRFELANELYRKLVGKEDIEGRTYLEAFPELAATEWPAILDRVYRTGEPFTAQEHPMTVARGGAGEFEQAYFRFNLQPVRRSSGMVYGMMAVLIDITDIVKARHAQQAAQREREALLRDLEAANRTKDEFLAMLGHELRNPLAPIVTALELMKRRGDLKTSREQEIIHRQVHHVIRLVDDLLDVSRITRGKVALQKETLEIGEVVDRAVEMAHLLIEQRGHRLTLDVPAQGLRWHGDPTRLAQVVANLLTNAARYTPANGQISLRARSDGHRATIEVEDNGKGIAAGVLPKIFDLFYQGGQSQERAEGGLGVGLALVKSLVTMHGGSVEARSDGPGKGSTFVIRLPLADAEVQGRPAASSKAPQPTEGPRAASSKRILIVDDNADAADLLGEALTHGGHQVKVVYDPVAALDAAVGFAPELALLDIGLPVMDGYELAQQLRRELKSACSCRMYALTGFGQAADRERSDRAGFAGHFVKPVDLGALLKTVDGLQQQQEQQPNA